MDRTRVLSSSEDGTLRITDAERGAVMHTLLHGTPMSCFAQAPGHSMIATGGLARTVSIWQADAAKCTGQLAGHMTSIVQLAADDASSQAWRSHVARNPIRTNLCQHQLSRSYP